MLLSNLNISNKFIFNYSGSICDLHCFSEMLDFFKVAKTVIPNAHFMFLTLVEKEVIIKRVVQKGLNITDFTILAASPLKVNDYLSMCDVSVMFFQPTFIRWAASPTKLAECLASGLPIIVNKGIGDTEELLTSNRVGAIVDNFSESTYLKVLDEILGLLKEADIRLRCRKTAEQYLSLRYGTEQYIKIYESL